MLSHILFFLPIATAAAVFILLCIITFYLNKSNENICWRCTKKSCFGKVYTDNNNEVLSDQSIIHNHGAYSTTEIERQIIYLNCKRKAVDDPLLDLKK
ncbi:FLYWCH-type domain-containing protein [Aphis craccivora]|uniref:FLYWCH-type domain-containing protein n=1 Tax=Aphis craccivora TaxID=307492 RepID=A0A6G0YKR2_APHCR|nr:FLYWCH-type domain-containing protein [Aphis craccivora]